MNDSKTMTIGATILSLDQQLHDLVRPHAAHPLIRLLKQVGKAGDQPPMLTIATFTLAAGLASERPPMMSAGARMISAHLLATGAKNLIKRRVDRERPRPIVGARAPKPRPGRKEDKATTSFPSGHSAGTFALARAFGRAYPGHAGKALAAAGLVGAAQVGAGKHYLTDVLAGAALGLAAEAAVARLAPVAR